MKGLNGVKFLPLIALLIFMTVGCSSGGDDGIDGTGMRGTAAEGQPLASVKIKIKDVDGKTKETETDDEGVYTFADISDMQAPIIIRAERNGTDSLFGILPSITKQKTNIANVHPITDVASRNWFKHRSRDIEIEFESDGEIPNPPTKNRCFKGCFGRDTGYCSNRV